MKKHWLNIVLYRPQIPQNTGNIGRTCVGLNIPLTILGKPGFHMEDKYLKRAGLDYWDKLQLISIKDFEEFYQKNPGANCYYFTKNGGNCYYDIQYQLNDYLIFGQETDGLPPEILEKNRDKTVFIPMPGAVRSFNLSNAVAAACFEAYRQLIYKK